MSETVEVEKSLVHTSRTARRYEQVSILIRQILAIASFGQLHVPFFCYRHDDKHVVRKYDS